MLEAVRATRWRRLAGLIRPYWRQMLAALGGLLVSSACGLAFPLLIGVAVGEVITQGDPGRLGRTVLLLIALFALQGLALFVEAACLSVVGERVVYRLRTDLYRHLTALSLDFHDRQRTGELLSRLGSDIGMVRSLLTANAAELLGEVLALVGAVAIIFALSPSLTLFLLILAPTVAGGGLLLGRRLEGQSIRAQDALARATVVAEEGLAGIRVVQSFGREGYEAGRYARDLEGATGAAIRIALLKAGFTGLMVFLGFSAVALTIWFAGRQVAAGTLAPQLLTSFLVYGVQIAFNLQGLAYLYGESRQALGAVQRTFTLLDTRPGVQERPFALALPALAGRISFAGVRFSYEPGVEVLRGIDLAIAPGEVVALVGPSGAGKSTLFQLIPRFYDPTGGAVLVDGRDLREVTLASLRAQIGLVPQDALLFGGTVRENIGYGRLDAGDAAIAEAARAANAHGFIEALPAGYDTVVGERGLRLSGGQRQRIAIARAILKDPRILLLDEATSALDSESERLVQEALARLMRGRTTVIIAHRLSTVVAADRIVVLDQGRIEEIGTHGELLARGGLYARLYALQFRAEV